MGHVRGLLEFWAAAVRFAAGMLASLLPRRLWVSLDRYVPATAAAAASGAATVLLAAAIGIPGFLRYADYTASAHNEAALRGAEKNAELDNEGTLRKMPMMFNLLALPMFLILTPAGWASMYLGVTGAVRLGSGLLDEGTGDLLLTGVDALARRTIRGSRDRAARSAREAREGPETPDRIMSAEQLGIAADFVVVASRRKPDWDPGTVLVTPDGDAYRVGAIEERTIAGRLRTLYAVKAHKNLEAFRRVLNYELPLGRR